MILDCSPISLIDGERTDAINVFPGRPVLTFRSGRMRGTVIKSREVGFFSRVYTVHLSNGESLAATPEQKVAMADGKHLRFREIGNVEIGEKLRGEAAGVPITVLVIGRTVSSSEQARFVGFDTGGSPYVASGVLCR